MNITVVGTNRIAMPPERATLHLSVGCEADHMQTALQQTTATVANVRQELDAMKAAMPSPTTWFAVLPVQTRSWTPWNKDGITMPTRYGASAEIRVKFRDFAAMSAFATKVGSVRFVKLNSVEWALTDATKAELERRVLAAAVKDATDRATQIARAAGLGELEPVEIADPGLLSGLSVGAGAVDASYQSVRMRGAAAPNSDQVDLAPEDIEIAAAVHARFATLA